MQMINPAIGSQNQFRVFYRSLFHPYNGLVTKLV
jgi:hypothetical protein